MGGGGGGGSPITYLITNTPLGPRPHQNLLLIWVPASQLPSVPRLSSLFFRPPG